MMIAIRIDAVAVARRVATKTATMPSRTVARMRQPSAPRFSSHGGASSWPGGEDQRPRSVTWPSASPPRRTGGRDNNDGSHAGQPDRDCPADVVAAKPRWGGYRAPE